MENKPTAEKLIADYREAEAAAFREYVKLVKERDGFRRQGEIYEKLRKQQFAKYYETEKKILKLQEDLAIDLEDCPPAPTKKLKLDD